MNNLSSYCGLVDAKIRAPDKDLPVYFQDRCQICIKVQYENDFTNKIKIDVLLTVSCVFALISKLGRIKTHLGMKIDLQIFLGNHVCLI